MSPTIPLLELRRSFCIVQPTPPRVVKAATGANFDKIDLLKIYMDQFPDLQLTDKGGGHGGP